jgi:hypothetical protein
MRQLRRYPEEPEYPAGQTMGSKEVRTGFCGHCMTQSRQRLLKQVSYEIEDTEGQMHGATYLLGVCSTCDRPLMYHVINDFVAGSSAWFQEADLVWPDPNKLHFSVPLQVRQCFSEAYPIIELNPSAFAGQVRRALEMICKEKGAGGKNLADQLEWLATQHMIPETLSKMTTSLRILGNAGVHVTDRKVSVEDAWAIDGFFRSLVEYLYVAPAKLQEFERRLQSPPTPPRGFTFNS